MIKNYDNFFLPATDLKKGREFYKDMQRSDLAPKKTS